MPDTFPGVQHIRVLILEMPVYHPIVEQIPVVGPVTPRQKRYLCFELPRLHYRLCQ